MPIEFSFPYTSEGVPQCQILALGPQNSGKSFLIAHFVPLIIDDPERITVLGPPSAKFLANTWGVPYLELSTTDRDQQEAILRPIYNSPKHELLVIDEFDQVMTMGGRSYGAKALSDIVNTGRSLGKSYVGIGHGSAYIAKSAIQNADVAFISTTREPGLLDYAKKWMSNDIEDADYLIAHLPKHRFLVWCPQNSAKPFAGFAWVENGQFHTATPEEVTAWTTTQAKSTESTTEAPNEDETTPIKPADTATETTATSPSPTGDTPASAPTATGNTGPKRKRSTRDALEIGERSKGRRA